MICSADEIKQSILHTDQDVREAAVCYFAGSESSDADIMPLVIQAIETYGADDAFSYYTFLDDLVQTDDTLRWLIQQVKGLGLDEFEEQAERFGSYLGAIVQADPEVLKPHVTEILELDLLGGGIQENLTERLLLAKSSNEELWAEIEKFCQVIKENEYLDDIDFESANNVVEALGRHAQENAEKVLAILGDEANATEYCKRALAIRLAGEMRLEAAIPAIIDTLHEAPDDWIVDECERAMTRIGSATMIARLAADYATSTPEFRLSVACVLEDIHAEGVVPACLDFLKVETDEETRLVLLQSAVMNFATDAIEPARQFVLNRPLSPEVLEVRTTLLTACKLMGETFPEFEAWLEDSKNDDEYLKNWYKEHVTDDEDDDYEDEEEDDNEVIHLKYAPVTIVRKNELIGRNDPCPCGSGKKFKKCCYGKSPLHEETGQ